MIIVSYMDQHNQISVCNYINAREHVMAKIKEDGCAIKLYPKFHGDRKIVLAAVEQNGWAIKYCPRFLYDHEILSIAITEILRREYKQYTGELCDKVFSILDRIRAHENDMSLQWISRDPFHRRYINDMPIDIGFRW